MVLSVMIFYAFSQNESLRLDEAQSLWQSSRTPLGILNLIGQDVHVPLYPLLLHGWLLTFGNNVVAARWLSFLFFLLSIPVLYLVGKRIYNDEISLFATVMFSISPFMNWYGGETRMYSLFVLITLINIYFFLGILKINNPGSWVGFGTSALLGIYTHYFFLFILLVDLIFLIFNKDILKKNTLLRFSGTLAILAVLFSPWLIYVYRLDKVLNSTPHLLPPTSIDLFNSFSQFIIGFQTDYLNTVFLSLWPVIVLFGFLALRKNIKVSSETIYLALIFSLPVAFAFFASIFFRPIYLTRYLIFTLPPMYLLISWIFYRRDRFLSYFFYSLIFVIMITGLTIQAFSSLTPTKEGYREAVAYLDSNSTPSDIIVVSAPFTIYPVLYYYNGASMVATLPIWDQTKIGAIPPFSEDRLPQEIESLKGSHSSMWLLLSYDQGYSDIIRIYMDTHFERLTEQNFSPGLNLYQYKLRYD